MVVVEAFAAAAADAEAEEEEEDDETEEDEDVLSVEEGVFVAGGFLALLPPAVLTVLLLCAAPVADLPPLARALPPRSEDVEEDGDVSCLRVLTPGFRDDVEDDGDDVVEVRREEGLLSLSFLSAFSLSDAGEEEGGLVTRGRVRGDGRRRLEEGRLAPFDEEFARGVGCAEEGAELGEDKSSRSVLFVEERRVRRASVSRRLASCSAASCARNASAAASSFAQASCRAARSLAFSARRSSSADVRRGIFPSIDMREDASPSVDNRDRTSSSVDSCDCRLASSASRTAAIILVSPSLLYWVGRRYSLGRMSLWVGE